MVEMDPLNYRICLGNQVKAFDLWLYGADRSGNELLNKNERLRSTDVDSDAKAAIRLFKDQLAANEL